MLIFVIFDAGFAASKDEPLRGREAVKPAGGEAAL